jgi:hypothetical protein
LAASGWSQTPFFPFEETFDGPIDDDEPVTWLSGGFPVELTHVNGDLVLSGPTDLGPLSLGKAVVSKGGELVVNGNSSAQTVFRLSDEIAFGFIYTKSQAGFPGLPGVPPGGDSDGYFGNIDGNGLIRVGSFGAFGGSQTWQTDLDPIAHDVVLQLDTIGDTITASAWNADEPKPNSPPFATFTNDAARPPGVFGLGLGGWGDGAEDVTATFRSFKIATGLPPGILDNPGLDGFIPPGLRNGLPASSHHAVPEPTSAVLSLLGCSFLCFVRRRRQSNAR